MELIQHSREPVQSLLCSLYPASAVCIQEDFLYLREIIGFIKIIVYFLPELIILSAIIHTTEIVRMDQSMTFAFRRFRLDSFVHINHLGEHTVVLTMRSIRPDITFMFMKLQRHMVLIGIDVKIRNFSKHFRSLMGLCEIDRPDFIHHRFLADIIENADSLSTLPIACLNSFRKQLSLCILRDALVLFQTGSIKETGSFL